MSKICIADEIVTIKLDIGFAGGQTLYILRDDELAASLQRAEPPARAVRRCIPPCIY